MSITSKPFLTVLSRAEGEEYTDRKSRFISYIAPVSSEEEARAFIGEVCEMHPLANHHVYAYRINTPAVTARFSDDREPQGTAGTPTLRVLEGKGLVNAAIVTVRYFGGTLLGTGGLTKAYSQAAVNAANAACMIRKEPAAVYGLSIPYTLLGKVRYKMTQADISISGTEFGENAELRLVVPKNREDEFLQLVSDTLEGKFSPEKEKDITGARKEDGEWLVF